MRNQVVVLSTDAIVVCGMSAGTCVEAALAIKAQKRVVLMRPDEDVRTFFERLSGGHVRTAATAAEAFALATASL
jgi:hypothetical protein